MKVRDIAPFGVRMPSELKEVLEREAKINTRSLNSEIVDRLKKSMEQQTMAGNANYVATASSNTDYTHTLSDSERQFLGVFRRLPVEKQLALLSLFK